MKVCAQCGNKIGKKDKFCNNCGSASFVESSSKARYCLYCGELLEPKAKFCINCGKSSEGEISLSFLNDKTADTTNGDLDFLKADSASSEEVVEEAVEVQVAAPAPSISSLEAAEARAEELKREMENKRLELEKLLKEQEEKEAEILKLREEEERRKAEEAIRAEEERKRKEEEERIRAEQERIRAEEERKRKEEEERLRKEEEERLRKEEEERLRREEEERLRREEEERLRKEEEERLRKEEEERLRKEEEERLRREEEERLRREEEERLRREEEERLRKEEEERLRKEEEERLRREEEERLRREEEERLRREEEERLRREEEERLRKEEEERLRREEEERLRREEEERKRKEELLETHKNAVKLSKKALDKYDKTPDESRADLEIALDTIEDLNKKNIDNEIDISDVDELKFRIEEILGVIYYVEGAHKLAMPLIIDAHEKGSKKVTLYYGEWLLKNRSKMPSEPGYLVDLLDDAYESEKYEGEELALYYSMLAKIYHDGIGVKKDFSTAYDYYIKASELGDAKSTAKVGQCYLYGEGVHKDGKLALEYSQKAAEAGNETGIRNVAVCYDFGTGTKKNGIEAIKWYKMLLDKVENDRFAMYRIAYCMADPDKEYGTKPTPAMNEEAFAYAKKAVEGGEEQANYIIGYMYMMGKAVSQDYNQAVIHFNKAANYGNSKAKEKLKLFVKNSSGLYKLK